MRSGLFITLEGGEGAGKTTLMARLYRLLSDRGLHVVRTREPGGCRLGETVRSWLLSPEHSEQIGSLAELLLFLAARAQHLEETILPALEAGHVVLSDRFNDSTVAYQAYGRNLGVERVEQLCTLVCGGLEPDLTYLLDVEPSAGLQRASGTQSVRDRMESEDLRFHQRVREGFLAIAKKHTKRVHLLDALMDPRQVFESALEPLEELLLERKWKS